MLLGLLAVAAGACGGGAAGSTGGSTTTSSTASTGPAGTGAGPRPGASGTVASVSGSTLEVQNPSVGQVTVKLTATARLTETVAASRAQLALGDCVFATGPESGSTTTSFTASAVTISHPSGTSCSPTGGGPLGTGRFAGSGRPFLRRSGSSARPGHGSPGSAARRFAAASGRLSALDGSTLVVQGTRNGTTRTTTVTVSASTAYTQLTSAPRSAVAVGDCVAAVGPADQTGAVTATSVRVSHPGPSGCLSGGPAAQ